MFQPLTLFVGLRYLRAKRRNHFISFISLISMGGIALGVMTLITVISVMNGFEGEFRDRILGVISHASISGEDGRFSDWQEVLDQVRAHPNVVGAAPFIEQESMLRGRQTHGALVRGIDPVAEPEVVDILEMMRFGDLDELAPGRWQMILGIGLANRLGVRPGDAVMVFAPQSSGPMVGGLPEVRRFEVSGVFEAGVHEFDSALALVHLSDAQQLFRLGDDIGGVRLRLDDMLRAPWIARGIAAEMPQGVVVRDWTEQHANTFRAIQTEKVVMFVILSLIIAVAAFNMISTLVMVVTDKQADIAILKTMGLTPRGILAIFIVQGSLIGVIGTVIGTVLGVLLALNVETVLGAIETVFNFEFMPADLYYISDLPSDLRSGDVVRFASLALILSFFSTLYPAWRAAQTQPVEALRYD
ncbi:MAG: lipoprotein-releasing ABC transporter permease subunit [Wenzhouxiangella sp.]